MASFPDNRKPHLICLLLVLLVGSVYWQVGGHTFINFDDDTYIERNVHVHGGLTADGVSWAFTNFHEANWDPLTWLSHMADVELFGLSAGWHHRMNVLYHLVNTVLLFLLMWQMTGGLWRSAFVAALFGVHPLHVEPVAWVAARKDVLSTVFWIMTIGAYLRYVRQPDWRRYVPVLAFFVLGLMCKPMLVTVPFVLLLLDYWPLGRIGIGQTLPREVLRVVPEKIPLLVFSLLSGVVTYFAQASGEAITDTNFLPVGERIANSLVSYVVYLAKTVWPASLSIFYPHPSSVGAAIPAWQIIGSFLLLGGFTFLALWQIRRRPYLAVGWFWYLGTLVPVIGWVQIGGHARADRFTYVPLIGIFMALAWGFSELLGRWRFRRIALGALGGAAVLAYSALAWNQAGHWRDSFTVFSHALQIDKKNWLAWNNLGSTYHNTGQIERALFYYQEAIRIRPEYTHAWHNLGYAYRMLGKHQLAIPCYQEALRLDPANAERWNDLGVAFGSFGLHEEAIHCFRNSLSIDPHSAVALRNLEIAKRKTGQP